MNVFPLVYLKQHVFYINFSIETYNYIAYKTFTYRPRAPTFVNLVIADLMFLRLVVGIVLQTIDV